METSVLPWRRLILILAVLFAARAVVTIAIVPPFEGWDEYQHVAYLVHLEENGGATPRIGEATVSPRLLRALVDFPAPAAALDQLGPSGCVSPATFWSDGASYREDHPPMRLYQAQHSPFYYRVVRPLFRAAGGVEDLRTSVAVLRLTNALFGMLAMVLILQQIGRWFREHRCGLFIAVAVSLQPLFLVNSCRVANDALAILLVTAGICATLALRSRVGFSRAIVAGGLLGAAVHAKTLAIAAVPWALVAVIFAGRAPLRRRWAVAVVLGVIAAAVQAPTVIDSLSRYGTLTPMQESIANERTGAGVEAWCEAILSIDWLGYFRHLWTDAGLWISGWSRLVPRSRYRVAITVAVAIGIAGVLIDALRRRRVDAPARLGLGLAFWTSAALAFHMIQTKLAWGVVATGAHYAAFAIPWWYAACLSGGRGLGRAVASALPAAVALIFTIVEVHGWLRGIVHHAACDGVWDALARVGRLQPDWLQRPAVGVSLGVWATVLAGLVLAAVAANRLRYRSAGSGG